MMHRRFICCACFVILQLLFCAPTLAQNEPGLVRVLIQTEMGDIEVEVETARAPVTAANFLKYVDAQYYDGGLFHRPVKRDHFHGGGCCVFVGDAAGRDGGG